MRKLSIMAGIWCWRWNSRLGRAVGTHSLKQREQRLRDLRAELPQRVEPYRHLRQTRRCLRPRQRQRIRQFRPWLHSNGHLRRRHRGERSTGGQTDRVAGAPRLYPATNVAVPTTANAIPRQIDSTGLNRAASSFLAQNWCFRDFDRRGGARQDPPGAGERVLKNLIHSGGQTSTVQPPFPWLGRY
jgi:hypothetical protein